MGTARQREDDAGRGRGAHSTGAHFERISAVSAGVADLRRIVAEARARRRVGRRTVLFIDEIHRFNKGQQDAVLPYVEDGTVTLIGATTENPSFEVNSALLSRARVFVLQALSDDEVATIVDRALRDRERGLGAKELELESDAKRRSSDLPTATRAPRSTRSSSRRASLPEGTRKIDATLVREAMQRRNSPYDKGGDMHYDVVSAFIKSIRASDPNASLYWLARMIEGGEDPLFIARRLVILASEDVGLADSQWAASGRRSSTGRAFRRYARGILSARARDALLGHGAEKQRGRAFVRRRDGRCIARHATIPFPCTYATRRPV